MTCFHVNNKTVDETCFEMLLFVNSEINIIKCEGFRKIESTSYRAVIIKHSCKHILLL